MLVCENHRVLRQMIGLATGEKGLCCWAVVPNAVGGVVQQLIATGETEAALRVLNAVALHGGPMCCGSCEPAAFRRDA